MDIKKLAIGLIVLGILIAGYGIIAAFTSGPKAPTTTGLEGQLDKLMAADEKSEIKSANLPYILVGGGIIVLGVVVRFASKKSGA